MPSPLQTTTPFDGTLSVGMEKQVRIRPTASRIFSPMPIPIEHWRENLGPSLA
jgi:hypothetical protein